MSSTTLGVKVDPIMRDRIRTAAERIGRTQHWFIKQSIYSMLEEIEAGRLPASLQHALLAEATSLVDLEEAGLCPMTDEKVQPFLEFAQNIAVQSVLRSAITSAYRRSEAECMPMLLELAEASEHQEAIKSTARKLVETIRNKRLGSGVDGLIHEYSLSSQEGVALMCLAEALLRIPDKESRDALIRDKISKGDWQSHLSSGSLFVNAATWGLMVTGKLVSTNSEKGMSSALSRLISKGGEPLIRQAVDRAMRLMGEHFVCGETIAKALANSRKWVNKGFNYSYDMLGEAAMTDADAQKYYDAYEQAIHAIGKNAAGLGIYEGPGISIKLSALHARYSRAQYDRVMSELYPRLLTLCQLAHQYDIGINIDAEEADRLELSLDLLERLCHEPSLSAWNGIGFVIQAYQKRAPFVIDYVSDLARRTKRRLMIRLVKGAYWDSEVKRAQTDGLEGYPVYTRKVHTDVCYLACARKLLNEPEYIFPQFATHNAQTVAAIYHMAGSNFYQGQYEFQCLHGMGEPLYEEVVGKVADHKLNRPCRIYAPVGSHETLLAYLVRRLLENGANSSFVNQIANKNTPIDELIADPVSQCRAIEPLGSPHPMIPEPRLLYRHQGESRLNSQGLDLSNEHRLASLSAGLLASATKQQLALPATLGLGTDIAQWPRAATERLIDIINPADHRDIVGQALFSKTEEVTLALERAEQAQTIWAVTPACERADSLIKAADLLEARGSELINLAVREAGKSYPNAVAELREAVDFLRYYAYQVADEFQIDTHPPLGPVVCISPWNFPLAIFLGQIAAALAAGNVVLAKPAEQTPLIAHAAVQALHEGGIPQDALQLLPGAGDVGATLVADKRVQGVLFTGSTEVAKVIAETLSQRLNAAGQPIPLIAETGGLNAMVVDSSALAEQVTADVINSAFDSAGQRCSALRILCVQEDVADKLITMLRGAMHELCLGNPDRLRTDVGPVIDAEAQQNISDYIEEMRSKSFKIEQLSKTATSNLGTFIPPTIIEVNKVADVTREVFGPVLHILRYQRENLNDVIDEINAHGYGLTFGIHSRIDENIDKLSEQINAGNIYVNRNIVGAVVGVQPFGGQGLSGTGPKAGGPLYALRLVQNSPPPTFESNEQALQQSPALTAINHFKTWIRAQGQAEETQRINELLAAHMLGIDRDLPGPTGERNTYRLLARGHVLCLPSTELGAKVQLASCLASGNKAIFLSEEQAFIKPLLAQLPEELKTHFELKKSLDALLNDEQFILGAALFEGDSDQLKPLAQRLALYAAAIIQPQALSCEALQEGQNYRLERLCVERSISVNTSAAGGNATLMAMI
ncbi:MAG: trifunctional transcriptional regulator/proline dehydrogenase/L-glutamate gamma-semialdehyde dehydrogenase [Alcaligenaceae bacterium]|nr:trifunctional transcriptional regulator/proline dehydrogenase/L-glutamate gamma-semialdehyde dehydrogenase [Alcaligenaceae bacterium]